jgi:micrococcal nuclease
MQWAMRLRSLLLPVLLLALVAAAWAGQGLVDYVADGDTLFLADRTRVRLVGIDAPELGRDGAPDGLGAREARDFLERNALGRTVALRVDGRDHYGRLLALAFAPGAEESLNMALLRAGLAYYYPHRDQDPALVRGFLAIQRQAMEQNKGFWPALLDSPMARRPYVGNARSMRFHALECKDAGRVSPRNRREFDRLSQAFGAGYAPARHCVDWPAARD